jgi:putative chitinase
MWFWKTNNLNALADKDDKSKNGEAVVEQITRVVNGGKNGLADRKYYYKRFKKEFF